MIVYHFILKHENKKYRIFCSKLCTQYYIWEKRPDVEVYNLSLIKFHLDKNKLSNNEYYHEEIK